MSDNKIRTCIKFLITQVMTVETVFHEENNQRERGRDADGEQYSLNVVWQTLPLIHCLVNHAERLDHDDHVQQGAKHEQDEDLLMHGWKITYILPAIIIGVRFADNMERRVTNCVLIYNNYSAEKLYVFN